MTQNRILILDDDNRLRSLLTIFLEKQGFTITGAENAHTAERHLERERYDVLILDLMLPDDDGLSVCQRLRAKNYDIPIIMLTAKGDDVDRIVGLEVGADDYLPKPFNPRELVARIKAVLRRVPQNNAMAPDPEAEDIHFGDCIINMASRQLFRRGEKIQLTSGEFGILKLLCSHPNRPLSRDHLLSQTTGRSHTPFDRSVDVQISRLRKLLEPDPKLPRYIQTIRSQGYAFVPDRSPSASAL
ncbi:MAG TPA: two-component system response regulator OmpR [Gammaproteobacteria bacterium]|nr:two-component system response regulator OmpR [Gammaproteobacteria bacterium]